MTHRLRNLLVALLVMVLIVPAFATVTQANQNTDSTTARSTVDRTYALVQLKGAPLATSAKTHPPQGKKIDFNSANVKAYRAQLAAQRNDFKAWLRANAPQARVTGEFDISLNAVSVKLNGERLDTLRAAPQVRRAEFQGRYYPLIEDPDLTLIKAFEAWAQAGGPANAGAGVKVAIVDSGIDVTHPCFDDAGYPDVPELGDPRFTNNKVIVAKVFYNKANVSGLTAEAIGEHGTHVAGTVACNYQTPAVVNGVDIPYDVSGVAPRALLGNYNVFPGHVESARSEDILNALEAAYADGFDIINMSLGGGANGIQDLLTMAVNNLDLANVVVAVSAGNEGPGHYTVGSPGSAERALTAGASTVPHFVGAPVTVGGNTYGAAAGDFKTVTADLTAPLAVVAGTTNGLSTACTPLNVDLTGKIALISRGACDFTVKILNAQNAGAIAVLVVNNVMGDPTAMGSNGAPTQPTIPAYMIGLNEGKTLVSQNGALVTISKNLQYFLTSNANFMAGFSSQGPSDVDFRIKPDVVAPGVNVLSSIPGDCGATGCWAFYSGTSMAAPHLAGSAAVVKGQHPTWTSAQIRSAIVNTADRNVLRTYNTGDAVLDPQVQGAGLENLLAAVNAKVALNPVSVTYNAIPSGGGQSANRTVTLTNLTASTVTYTVAISGGKAGVTYAVSPSSVTLAPGASATVTVSMTAVKGAGNGDYSAWLTVSGPAGEVAHAAIYTFVK